MSKIRINELARELEVKPSVIIDLLPELGVEEKKTHSSSLEGDVLLRVRRLLAPGSAPAATSVLVLSCTTTLHWETIAGSVPELRCSVALSVTA